MKENLSLIGNIGNRRNGFIWILSLSFLAVCLFSIPVFADDLIQGHYCYTYEDNESLKERISLKKLNHHLYSGNIIYIDYFDSLGNPFSGDRSENPWKYMQEDEIRTISFYPPPDAVSWRVWLRDVKPEEKR